MLPEFEAAIYNSEKIDALTVTSKSVAGRAMIMGLYKNYVEESNNLGFEQVFKSLGYKGYQCDSVRWGSRLDGSVLFTSGDSSMQITHMLLNELDYDQLKTTRIDVCIDIALQNPVRGWLRALRESQEFQDRQADDGRKTTIIESDTGDTLYIGSRVSGRFGRIYDKSLTYGVELGYVYRFELETKKQVAPAVFKRLFPEGEDTTYSWDCFSDRVRGIIQAQFLTWGLNLNLRSSQKEQVRAELRVSTVDSQLEYLSRSVAPMLIRLTRAGYQSEMFEALGISLANFE